jgi:hypothetical protein
LIAPYGLRIPLNTFQKTVTAGGDIGLIAILVQHSNPLKNNCKTIINVTSFPSPFSNVLV